jgi:hypothetical protein
MFFGALAFVVLLFGNIGFNDAWRERQWKKGKSNCPLTYKARIVKLKSWKAKKRFFP